jgi:four helix bundle protein
MSRDSILYQKSKAFAKRIVMLYRYLGSNHKEFILSKQVLRSGTSIGANVTEAIYAGSRKDFLAKLHIAQKEAAETLYWLELLSECNYLPDRLFHSLYRDCNELMSMLVATTKPSG